MAFGWSSDHADALNISESQLAERLLQITGPMKYYSPAIHKASFALPPFIALCLEQTYPDRDILPIGEDGEGGYQAPHRTP